MINMQDKNFLIRIKQLEKALEECAKLRLTISIYRLKYYILDETIGLDPEYRVFVEILDPDFTRHHFRVYKAHKDYHRSDYSDVELMEIFKPTDVNKYLKGKRKEAPGLSELMKQLQLEKEVEPLVLADPNSDFNFTWFLFLGNFYNICKGYGVDGEKSVVFLP